MFVHNLVFVGGWSMVVDVSDEVIVDSVDACDDCCVVLYVIRTSLGLPLAGD